jgi:hypothetical protein
MNSCSDRFLSAPDPAAALSAFEMADDPDGQRDQRQNDRAEQGRQLADWLERFPAKWRPVRAKKTRQKKIQSSVPIQSERKKLWLG